MASFEKDCKNFWAHYNVLKTKPAKKRSWSENRLQTVYRVIQEESALLWDTIVWVILSKKVHTNMGPILNGYRVMTAWNLEKKVMIIDNERKIIINQHNTWYI